MSDESLADRMWWAWHCLPREGRWAKPPERKGLEAKYGLSNGVLARLFKGEQKTVSSDTLPKIAAALNVSADWLTTGKGEPPKLTGPFRARPEEYPQADTLAIATATQGQEVAAAANNLEQAISELLVAGPEHLPDTREVRLFLAEIRKEFRGRENEKPVTLWGLYINSRRKAAAVRPKQKRARAKKDPPPPARVHAPKRAAG